MYDQTGPGVLAHIQSFIKTYDLPLEELLVQDLTQYPVGVPCASWRSLLTHQTFNAFFARKLVATARPITSPREVAVVTSPADCRLSVFPSVDAAKTLW